MPATLEKTVSIGYFKSHISEIADEIENGGAIYSVTRYNRPIFIASANATETPVVPRNLGRLAAYADPSKIALEGKAWEAYSLPDLPRLELTV